MGKAIGSILGSAIMVVVAKYLHVRQTRRAWREAGAQLGLSYAREGWGRSGLRLWGDVGGVEVLVHTEKIPGKFGWKRFHTVFEVSYGQHGLYEVQLEGVVDDSSELIGDLERIADEHLEDAARSLND